MMTMMVMMTTKIMTTMRMMTMMVIGDDDDGDDAGITADGNFPSGSQFIIQCPKSDEVGINVFLSANENGSGGFTFADTVLVSCGRDGEWRAELRNGDVFVFKYAFCSA